MPAYRGYLIKTPILFYHFSPILLMPLTLSAGSHSHATDTNDHAPDSTLAVGGVMSYLGRLLGDDTMGGSEEGYHLAYLRAIRYLLLDLKNRIIEANLTIEDQAVGHR